MEFIFNISVIHRNRTGICQPNELKKITGPHR
jgi:hypothetical protein